MPRNLLLLAALLVAVSAAIAPASDRQDRLIAPDELPVFRAVGRLNVAGARFCTATLVSPVEIVTAAHCLFHPRTGARVPVSEMRFVAGLYREAHAALRTVEAAAVPAGFVLETGSPGRSIQRDFALLRLSEPIALPEATPFPAGVPNLPEALAIVGYSRERPFAPSRVEPCRSLGQRGNVVALSCRISFGASGAPVIDTTGGGVRIAAIASAIGRTADDGHAATFAVRIGPQEIEALRRQIDGQAAGNSD
jgi:protease YdgD